MHSKAAFAAFANRKGNQHPWNAIERTHNLHHCEWLITTGQTTSLSASNIIHMLPTSTLPKEHVASFVVEEVGILIPADLDDVIDTIFCWGTRLSGLWTGKVLHVPVHSCLLGAESPNRKKICFSFVAILLHEHLGVPSDSPAFEDMMCDFVVHHQHICNRNKHFCNLTVESKAWCFENCVQSGTSTASPQHVVVAPERAPSSSCTSSALD